MNIKNTPDYLARPTYVQDPLHETTQTAAPLKESLLPSMYGQEPPGSDRAIPRYEGIPAGEVLNLQTLRRLIVGLQTQQAESARKIKQLERQLLGVQRGSRGTAREIETLYHELDGKVTRKD